MRCGAASVMESVRRRRGSFHNVKELIGAIRDYIRGYNQNPRVFVWSASVESILTKVAKCKDFTNDLQTIQGNGTRVVILDKRHTQEELRSACAKLSAQASNVIPAVRPISGIETTSFSRWSMSQSPSARVRFGWARSFTCRPSG